MSDALITGIVAIIVCVISNIFSLQATKAQNDKTMSLFGYRLDELTKKVEKHNNFIERLTKLEQLVNVMGKTIDELKSEIEKLRD